MRTMIEYAADWNIYGENISRNPDRSRNPTNAGHEEVMVAYNFSAEFANDVETGRKCQTIRKEGNRIHARKGDRIQLYTGMGSKACRKIGEAVCSVSTYCAIREDGITTGNYPQTDIDEFARNDGFRDFEHMKDWFREKYHLPFIGRLIIWVNL